ncbi:MAG: transposase [Methylocystis silviterrae]
MAEMSDRDWETLHDNFDTSDLLKAVDCLDGLRGLLSDREQFQPVLRGELLKLHELAMKLAMKVIGEGALVGAPDMFELAADLQDQVSEMVDGSSFQNAADI